MQTLGLALSDERHIGDRIHLPWGLDDKINFYTMDVAVLAGAPGAGKSTIAVNLAAQMRTPMLYLAQDSPNSVMARITALTLGEQTQTVLTQMADPESRQELASKMGGKMESFVFHRGQVSVEQIERMCVSLREWMGKHPPVVVVDNLIDLTTEGASSGENTFYARNLQEIKDLAIRLNMGIILLHHVTRGAGVDHGRGRSGITMNDLLFAGEREARHVWGTWNNGGDTIHVQVLKQTDGMADPEAGVSVPLRWYPDYSKVERSLTRV